MTMAISLKLMAIDMGKQSKADCERERSAKAGSFLDSVNQRKKLTIGFLNHMVIRHGKQYITDLKVSKWSTNNFQSMMFPNPMILRSRTITRERILQGILISIILNSLDIDGSEIELLKAYLAGKKQ